MNISVHSSINSPFRYAGGKFYARKLIIPHIPRHTHYIEPFAGGASIFFVKPKVEFNHLNDIDSELINVYRMIRDEPTSLVNFLKKNHENINIIPNNLISNIQIGKPLPATKELHTFFKNEFKPESELEKAGRWFYLNRTSYSGIMNTQNMYWGYGDKYSMQPKNWPRNIFRTSEKLQEVQLTSYDFEQIIETAPDNSFLFVDPPYYNADQDKFYTHSFTYSDHLRLAECLRRNSNRLLIFLTYDNTDEIREMYGWMNEIHDKEWNYCIQRTDDQKNGSSKKGERYKGKELFILNYDSENIFTEDYVLI